jgi:hypothetical protein
MRPRIISLFTGAVGSIHRSQSNATMPPAKRCGGIGAGSSLSEILAVPSTEVLETAGIRVREADLLIGGPPCQSFSDGQHWIYAAETTAEALIAVCERENSHCRTTPNGPPGS